MIATNTALPEIIQGGMGVAVSGWQLARTVAESGQMGVVSGTGIDTVLIRRLQMGSEDGELCDAFRHFPLPEVAAKIWNRYFINGGKQPEAAFRSKPIFTFPLTTAANELIILANFVEVYLAKKGHDGVVGINLLEKIQIATLPSLLGAMMADVDYVLMGAGIPREIPAILDCFAEGKAAKLRMTVAHNDGHEEVYASLDPAEICPGVNTLKRPKFLAIVSSSVLAVTLARKSPVPPDGFVLEAWTAGGHNAPPRGAMHLDDLGQPVYGPRDEPDLAQVNELGLPFWLAGAFGSHEKLEEAKALGAQGIQVGTAFAFCNESGVEASIKQQVIEKSSHHEAHVHTDPKASPTGFPFKVVDLPDTVADPVLAQSRERVCDLGYLRQLYRKSDGALGFRCSAEPIESYVKKEGDPAEAAGRKCLCNGLMATIGLAQRRKGWIELPIVTAGDHINSLEEFIAPGEKSYSAKDVIERLLVKPNPA